MERYEEAIAAGQENKKYVEAVRGHLVLPWFHYPHFALAFLALYTNASPIQRLEYEREVRSLLKPARLNSNTLAG